MCTRIPNRQVAGWGFPGPNSLPPPHATTEHVFYLYSTQTSQIARASPSSSTQEFSEAQLSPIYNPPDCALFDPNAPRPSYF